MWNALTVVRSTRWKKSQSGKHLTTRKRVNVKTKLRIFAALAVLFLFLVPLGSALAQDYYFSVVAERVDVYWQADGTLALDYEIVFLNGDNAHEIDVVDLGLPNDGYNPSNITATLNDQPASFIEWQSEYIDVGPAIYFSNPIPPGGTGTFRARITGLSDVLYTDSEDESYASAVFIPNYFGSEFVFGASDITVVYHLPPGVQPAEPRWHTAGQTGTLRATIFGVNDGLVSNLALVMGVAGAAAQPSIILLAGIAGLLAGAFSMAAGEWISMQSQRELFERQIELERAELAAIPEEEEIELALIYRRKGFTDAESASIARRLMSDPKTALDTLVREELGLDPDQLGSPWGAAGGSFLAFSAGAALPVLPYLLLGDTVAFWLALGLSLAALFLVGAAVSLLTGRSAVFSGVRQSLIGGAAAAVTYAVGAFVGVTVAG